MAFGEERRQLWQNLARLHAQLERAMEPADDRLLVEALLLRDRLPRGQKLARAAMLAGLERLEQGKRFTLAIAPTPVRIMAPMQTEGAPVVALHAALQRA